MKTIISLLAILSLTGCATAFFDNVEYNGLTEIRYNAAIAIDKCSKPEQIYGIAADLMSRSKYLVMYSEHLPYSEESTAIYKKIEEETQNFAKTLTDMKMSTFYCKSKLENIRDAAETAQKTIAKRKRS
jgi:hypothetical protein